MKFDTCHEYCFYQGNSHIHYCEDHQTLMIVNHQDSTNRLMIEGISKDEIMEFRLELNKLHLENADVTNKDLVT